MENTQSKLTEFDTFKMMLGSILGLIKILHTLLILPHCLPRKSMTLG